jgi:hypothetical protein
MEKNGIFLVTRICRYFLPVVFFLSLDNQKKGTIGYKKGDHVFLGFGKKLVQLL